MQKILLIGGCGDGQWVPLDRDYVKVSKLKTWKPNLKMNPESQPEELGETHDFYRLKVIRINDKGEDLLIYVQSDLTLREALQKLILKY